MMPLSRGVGLFPIIFIALGFLIHSSLETNKKLLEAKKPRKFTLIICLLAVTLLADAFVGYKIAQGIYNNEFNVGMVTEQWHTGMAFTAPDFYLVLILGFVVYVIWGFLLHYVLGHSYLRPDSERVKVAKKHVDGRIYPKLEEREEMITTIHKLEEDINDKQKDYEDYENGTIHFKFSELKGVVGEFVGGWQSYTNGYYSNKEALELNNKSLSAKEIWLKKQEQEPNNKENKKTQSNAEKGDKRKF